MIHVLYVVYVFMLRDYDTAKYIVLLFFSMNYNVLNLQYNIRIMMDVSGIST